MVRVTARFEYQDVGVDGDDGPIIKGFSAVIPAEGLTAIVGPSGAGKTTLLRLLNRLDDPDDGVVLFEGRDSPLTSPRRPSTRRSPSASRAGNRSDWSGT